MLLHGNCWTMPIAKYSYRYTYFDILLWAMQFLCNFQNNSTSNWDHLGHIGVKGTLYSHSKHFKNFVNLAHLEAFI